MARLQILELPMVHVGEASETPFVLVVDQAETQRVALGAGQVTWISEWERAAQQMGARTVIVTPGTVEIPANGVPLPPSEPLELISSTEDTGGHAFDVPGYQDPQRCARCEIDRVSWRTGSDRRPCGQVLADHESGHRFLPINDVLTCHRCGMTRLEWATRRDAPKCDAVGQREAG